MELHQERRRRGQHLPRQPAGHQVRQPLRREAHACGTPVTLADGPTTSTFEWYIAAVDDTAVSPHALPPSYPWRRGPRSEPGHGDVGAARSPSRAPTPPPCATTGVIMRYKGYCPCGNQYAYSAFAGDPSAKPSEVRAQLAEGWIKRVVNALNPFDTRVKDFVSAPVNTTVDMIQQAGKRYEGPIAMNSDPGEPEQDRADRSLPDGAGSRAQALHRLQRQRPGRQRGAAQRHLPHRRPLHAAGQRRLRRRAGPDWSGSATSSSLGSRAPAIFAFMNQFRPGTFGLIDEELALLRGRDRRWAASPRPPPTTG